MEFSEDIQKLIHKTSEGAEIPPEDCDWFLNRFKTTREGIIATFNELNVSQEEFFAVIKTLSGIDGFPKQEFNARHLEDLGKMLYKAGTRKQIRSQVELGADDTRVLSLFINFLEKFFYSEHFIKFIQESPRYTIAALVFLINTLTKIKDRPGYGKKIGHFKVGKLSSLLEKVKEFAESTYREDEDSLLPFREAFAFIQGKIGNIPYSVNDIYFLKSLLIAGTFIDRNEDKRKNSVTHIIDRVEGEKIEDPFFPTKDDGEEKSWVFDFESTRLELRRNNGSAYAGKGNITFHVVEETIVVAGMLYEYLKAQRKQITGSTIK